MPRLLAALTVHPQMHRCESCTILPISAFWLQDTAGVCIDLQKLGGLLSDYCIGIGAYQWQQAGKSRLA